MKIQFSLGTLVACVLVTALVLFLAIKLRDHARLQARTDSTAALLNNVMLGMEAYWIENKALPDHHDESGLASDPHSSVLNMQTFGGMKYCYEKHIPDAWGNYIRYKKLDKNRAIVWSQGPKGAFLAPPIDTEFSREFIGR